SFISSTKPVIECCLDAVYRLAEERPICGEGVTRRPRSGAEPGPGRADSIFEIAQGQWESVNQPTLPSSVMPSSCCASTANSMGSSLNTSRQNPLTIIDTACSALTPRCLQKKIWSPSIFEGGAACSRVAG